MALTVANAQMLPHARARRQDLRHEIDDATPNDGIAAQAWFLNEANAWRTRLQDEACGDNDQLPFSFFASDSTDRALQLPDDTLIKRTDQRWMSLTCESLKACHVCCGPGAGGRLFSRAPCSAWCAGCA